MRKSDMFIQYIQIIDEPNQSKCLQLYLDNKERFDKALQKVLTQPADAKATEAVITTVSQAPQQSSRIVVKDGSKIRIIPVAQVQYLEAADDYVKIFTAEGHFLKKKTMQYFEQTLLAQQFVRIHRSYIINVQLITRIDAYEKESYLAILSSGQKLPVSKSGYFKLKEVLGM